MKTTIYLVRHGHSVANKEHIVAGLFDKGLSKEGRKQAKCVAKFFKNKQVNAVYSSHLPRAETTAMYTAKLKKLPLNIDPRIMEFNFGEYEGMKAKDAFEKASEVFKYYLSKAEFTKLDVPGGETPEVCAKRVYEAIIDIAKNNEGKSVVVVAHAVAILCFTMFVENGYTMNGAIRGSSVSNASVSVLEIEDGIVNFKETNYTGHLKYVTCEKEDLKK